MHSVRAKLLMAMLACAVITLIGSLIAWRGLERLENQIVSITNQTWPTADACMELWIAELTKDRARLHPDRSRAAEQFEWAQGFAQGALDELTQAGEMSPEMVDFLTQLDRGLNEQVSRYLESDSPEEQLRLDDQINDRLLEIEAIIVPEEDSRDVAMDVAADDSLGSVRENKVLLAVVTLVAVLVAFGLALWLSTRIVRPLHRLAGLAQRLGAGESVPALRDFSRDEVGNLARNFDDMAQRLSRSRDELLTSEQRYRTLFEHARHGIVVMDSDLRILEANPAMGALLQLELSSLKGTRFTELLAGGEARFADALRRIVDEQHPSVELEFRGSEETVVAEVNGVQVPDGRTVLVVRDMRELRRIEQALIQSEKLSAVGQLAAGVAHELRNPLFVISNVIYELRDSLQGDREYKESLDIADEENARARKIIDNLLEFSRASPEGTRSLVLDDALQRILLLFRKTLEKNHIDLNFELGAVPPCVFDPDGFKQVIVNLLTNAVDAMPDGGTLTIRTQAVDPERVRIEIADTGGGMDDAALRQVFNPFYSTKAPGAGTGLGLWIVHSTVARFDGRIEVSSEPGQGTTFILELAAAPGSASAAAAAV